MCYVRSPLVWLPHSLWKYSVMCFHGNDALIHRHCYIGPKKETSAAIQWIHGTTTQFLSSLIKKKTLLDKSNSEKFNIQGICD